MEQKLILTTISFDEIMDGIREVVKSEILQNQKAELDKKLLSPTETAKLLQVSKVTIWNWTKEGKIQEHHISGKAYYKYSEIMAAIQTLKKYKRG